jgi:hypothetical protein
MFALRKTTTGSNVPAEGDGFNQLIALSQGGSLQRACEAGRLYSVANQAKVATTAGLTTTWTGLGVANPAASTKNLVFHEFGFGFEIAGSTAGAVGLMTADTTGFASQIVAIQNCLDGATVNSVAWTEDGCTCGTPILKRLIAGHGTAATSAIDCIGPFVYDLKGGLILPPGRAVLTYTTLGTTATFTFHFVWEEIDA